MPVNAIAHRIGQFFNIDIVFFEFVAECKGVRTTGTVAAAHRRKTVAILPFPFAFPGASVDEPAP
jgi:hypothetical protein